MNRLNKWSKFLLDLLFPNCCPFCGKFIVWDRLACDSCIDQIPYTGEELCALCGKSPCICAEELFYDKCFTAVYYEGIVKDGVLRLKIKNGINTAEFFAEILAEKIKSQPDIPDFIVPVPMSRKKKSERGYNQAEEIARFLSRKLKIPMHSTVLRKNDGGVEQHTLNAVQRKEQVNTLYFAKPTMDFYGKKILLCDDVITTGNTMNACSLLLKNLGAAEIILAAGATTLQKQTN